MSQTKHPNCSLVVITGPTASGKTSLAVELAKEFGGEIISADSRAVYRDINIASAKPSIEEMMGVPHWGFDLAYPSERFTAYDFKLYAQDKINSISSRGKIPFLVGGTGLYIDSILFDYDFGAEPNYELRDKLNSLDVKGLIDYCVNNNVSLPENSKNKRHLIRAIERSTSNYSCKKYTNDSSIVVGITTNKDILRSRIDQRNREMLNRGIIKEAILLAEKYGWDSEPMKANAYPLIRKYIEGHLSESELLQKMSTTDWRLAKRQIAFMKRNQYIVWLELENARDYIISKLKNHNI